MKDFIQNKLREDLEYYHADDAHPEADEFKVGIEEQGQELMFNNGSLNKKGPNTISLDGEVIVDFGIGEIGNVDVNGQTYPNSMYLKGGYNASKQRMGYGTLGVKFIFEKLPKIQYIIVDCYDTACPFWMNIGGEKVYSRKISDGGHELHTVVISRDSFRNSVL